MLRWTLTLSQRRVLIEIFRELANFGVASLFFGQFLSDRAFLFLMATSSLGLWIALVGLSLVLAAEETP